MFFNKVKSFAGKALGAIGGGLKKIGDVGSQAIRTLGSVSAPLQGGISAAGSLFGPEGSAIAGMVNRGISAVTSGKAQSLAAGISGAGRSMQSLANNIAIT